ncbi:crotonobetainyl CoA hydratase [metagenome]|uniref:Crotonobetainyl CoA hydratase n=1 Tax=metagenome TaxID=256318 RepID=A0A2P2C892_9ZZZZ
MTPEPMTEPVHTQVRDGNVLLVTLDRPSANAVDVPTSRALYRAFRVFEDSPELRVAVLTGAGDRFFSAGWDLKAAAAGEGVEADHGPGGFAGLTEFFGRRKPVIAAVNGYAFGGGWELALAADLMLAARSASFAFPEVSLGIVADSGGVLRLPKRLPQAVATELLLTGRRMAADEAHRWGLVAEVVDDDQLLERALELASTIAAQAPLAIAAVLEILAATAGLGVEEGYQILRGGQLPSHTAMLGSRDALEGPQAFAEKRRPHWTGT